MDLANEASGTPASFSTSLDRLPAELLIRVVENVYSLDILWDLMRASPRVWRLFDRYGLEIMETFVAGPQSIIPVEVQEVVRNVILIRCQVFPYRDFAEFRRSFWIAARPKMGRHRYQATFLRPELVPRAPLTVSVLRSVVATAAHLVALSQACLATALERIRDPTFRPLHCDDPAPLYSDPVRRPRRRGAYHSTVSPLRPWDCHYTGTPVNVVDAGQPSWVEDMRALRAMWLIQLLGEASCFLENATGVADWTDEDIHRLEVPARFFEEGVSLRWTEEEFISAHEFLSTLGVRKNVGHCQLPRPPKDFDANRRPISSPKRAYQTGWKRFDGPHSNGPPVPLPTFNDTYHWGQTALALWSEAPGLSCVRRLHTADRSPILGVDFTHFRHLGFAFWDRKRVHLLGLMPGIDHHGELSTFYFFAWESILPSQVVSDIKAKLRNSATQ